MKNTLLYSALFLLGQFAVSAQAGSWRTVGKAGEYSSTFRFAGGGDYIYSIEQMGSLYKITASSGSWTKIAANFENSKFLICSTTKLVSIEKNGNMYDINQTSGEWKQVGKTGDWADAIASAIIGETAYVIDNAGTLYKVPLSTGYWSKVGKSEFGGTYMLLAGSTKLYSIENSGTLYEIDPETGSWKQIGNSEAYGGTTHATTIGNKLYTIEAASGILYETDLFTGNWKQIGNADYQATKFLTTANGKLYTIETSGTMYEINVK